MLKGGGARDYPQVSQLGETIDQCIGNPFRQIFHISIVARILERENDNGLRAALGRA